MSIRNDDFINRIGISNTENVRFNKLHNKFNVFQNQTITPSVSDGTLSTYVLNNELCFDNNVLTDGGSITGGGAFEVVDGKITQKTTNVLPCQFQDQSISSISSGDFGTITSLKGTITDLYGTTATITSVSFSTLSSSKGTITDLYSTNATITSIAVDTIAMSGSTRTITNTAGISFTALSPYITGVKTLTFSSGSAINDLATGNITTLNSTTGNITTLNSTTGNITTINSTNVYGTNVTVDEIYGGKNDGTRDYFEVVDGDYLKSPEIQVVNGSGDAKMYSQQYYIGTTASNQSLASYIETETNSNLGTLTGVEISAGIGGSPFGYKTSAFVPQQNVPSYTDYNGLKCDVIECDEFLKCNDLVCNNLYSNQGGGSSFLDFLTGSANAIGGIGNVISGASNLVAGGLVLGGGVMTGTGLIAVAISPSGNGYYNQHCFNWEETEWNDASEECGMESPYNTFDARGTAPTERKQMASFMVNPRSGRLSIATWGQTEDALTLSGENKVQWCDSGYINSHDQQYTIRFKNYSSTSSYESDAYFSPTCTFDGGNLISCGYENRLVNIDGRIYFGSSTQKLAFVSEIPSTPSVYWELNGGFLQPNSTSGFSGAVQINSSVMNIYTDIYLSGGHQLNFMSSSKAHIKYDDTAKTLTFQNGDDSGEFIFNDYLGSAQFKIDTANNRLELPKGGFFFQESGNQKIRKAGSGVLQISTIDNTEFLVGSNEEKIITLNEPSTWVSGYEYPVITLKDERTGDTVVRTSTQMELVSPNGTGQLYLRCDNGSDGDYTNVFYSRRQGASTGDEFNCFFDVPKTKFNNIQFTDSGAGTLSTGLEYTTNLGGNVLLWYDDVVLTNDAPNVSNRLTFTAVTLTNTGLEQNGSDLYWFGSKLNSQSGVSSYFTDDGTTATSVALDFTFAQDVFVEEQFSTGAINSRINLIASAVNEISQISMCNLKSFVEYNVTAGQQKLNIDFHCGTDSYDNINLRMGASDDVYLKIIPDSTTIYNDLIIDTGENLTLTQGDLTLTQGDIDCSDGTITTKNLQFIDMTDVPVNSGLEFTSNVGINALLWEGNIVLTNNAPNISNRLSFTSVTLTNTALEQNGSDLYWYGSKLNSQTDPYFTDDSTTATSSALDFSFTQDVSITGETTMKDTLKILSSNIATNYFSTSMSDSSMAFLLTGGSNPDAFYFKDYDSANICKIQRDSFNFYGSDTNTKFHISSSSISLYNPTYVNQVQSVDSSTELELGINGSMRFSILPNGSYNNGDVVVKQVNKSGSTQYGTNCGGFRTINADTSTTWAMFTNDYTRTYESVAMGDFNWAVNGYNKSYLVADGNGDSLNASFFHRTVVEDDIKDNWEDYTGLIVESTGKINNIFYNNDERYVPAIYESLPTVRLSISRGSKKVFGILHNKEGSFYDNGKGGKARTYTTGGDMGHLYAVDENDPVETQKRYDILSIGEGAVWVVNKGTIPENGDLFISSDILGYGEIASDDLMRSNVVGKLTTDWDLTGIKTRTVEGLEARLMGCVVYCG